MSYSLVKSTMGPRGRRSALGATGGLEQVAALQAQVNRFVTPPMPTNGILDQPTAIAAQSIIITRFQRAFVEDPSNKETARLFADASRNLGNALPWVRANLEQITDTLRDYGDFIGKPPAKGHGSSSAKNVALAIAGLAAVAYAFRRKRGRR